MLHFHRKFSSSITVGIRPVITMSSASINVTFMDWAWNCLTTELSDQMWATTIVMWDFFTLPSVMTAMLLEYIWDVLKAWLRFWRCWYKSLSDEEEGKLKLILLEKWLTTLESGEKREWRCWGIKLMLWSGESFWNISLVYKVVISCYLLIGLQWNMLYSKSNQHATRFLW